MSNKFNDSALCDIVRSCLDYNDKNIVTILDKSKNTELNITERNILLNYIKTNKIKPKGAAQIRREILSLLNITDKERGYSKPSYLNRDEMEIVLNFIGKAINQGIKP